MDMQLDGSTAFVSGSTGGIGYATAAALAAEGARVTLHGRTPERARAAVDRLRAEQPGAAVDWLAADAADPAALAALTDELGAVDVLVNNVGEFGLAAFEDLDDADWQRAFEVNVMSGVRLSRALFPGMLARGSGRVLFVSSESGVSVPADMVHYGVTKAAMIALGNGLAKRTRGTGVTVNTVLGGPTWSDGVARAVEAVAAAQGAPVDDVRDALVGQNRSSLLERFIDPAEVAALVVYLASPLAVATNGAALRVDGGVLTTIL